MKNPGSNRPYKWLAEHYDTLFNFHIAWYQSAREHVLAEVLPEVESACDLACGTGTTALSLASKGIKMYGVDLSPIMCRLAREKAKRLRIPLHVLRADMCKFRLPQPVDLILCEFDALNHINRKLDLSRVLRSASRALSADGHIYFDVNNRLAFETIWPGTWFVEKPGLALVLHGGYDPVRDRGWTNADWFIKDGRNWRRHRERIEQVAWKPTEIRHALQEAGFGKVQEYDATPFFDGDPRIRPGCRTFYLARKRNA